jgi:hypothetical protein
MTDGEAYTVLLRSFFPALKMDSGSYFGRGPHACQTHLRRRAHAFRYTFP